MMVWAIVVLALVAVAMGRLWRSDPVARFFATGLILAAIPINATMPGGRLLAFVGLGAMGLVAQFMSFAAKRGERVAAMLLAAVHLVLAPPLLALGTLTVGFAPVQIATDRAVPRSPDVQSKTVVLVNPQSDVFASALIAGRVARGEPRPASVLPLAGVLAAVDVTRVDARSLRIRPAEGFLVHSGDRNWRSLARPLLPGSVVELSSMTVTVLDSTRDLRPAEALFRFNVPLEDASLLWLRWSHGAFAPWIPPPIGETVHLTANDFGEMLLDAFEPPKRP
jgi:hypothetical protein